MVTSGSRKKEMGSQYSWGFRVLVLVLKDERI